MIQVQCPTCEKYLMASDEQAGTMMPCRHCGAWVTVPGQSVSGEDDEAQVPCPFCTRHIFIKSIDIGIPISCPHCRAMLRVLRDNVSGRLTLAAGEAEAQRTPIPWEDRGKLGIFRALWNTFKEVAFGPTRFFGRMKPLGMGHTVLFVMAISFIVALAGMIPQIGTNALLRSIVPRLVGPGPGRPPVPMAPTPLGLQLLSLLVGVVLAPLLAVLGLFISAALVHLALMVLGGAKTGYETTFRVMGYAQGATAFGVIPLCGAIVGGIWALVSTVIGLREVNRIGTGKALVAALIVPILVILCCGVFFVALFGAVLFAQV